MGNRRFTQVATSDDEDEAPTRPQQQRQQQQQSSASEENRSKQRKRKRMKLQDEEDEDEDEEDKKKKRKHKGKEEEGSQSVDEEVEQPQEDAKPIGEVIRVSGKGRWRRKYYESFEFDGNQYTLEDPVLLVPEDKDQKPYVAIIKDIAQSQNGMMVTGQWFYRPEEAERKGGGSWQSRDTRELFYSFHRDEVPAESVMHKCVVHFVPIHKQLPNRKQHPGFIVQKVYDTVERKLWKLTDKDYEDNKQQEIDDLVQKTLRRIVDLPDIENEEAPADQEDQMKNKRSFRRRNVSPLDVSREDDATLKNENLKPETPGSGVTTPSEHYKILVKFNVLTGDTHRDRWLERLLQHVQYMCKSDDNTQKDDKAKDNSDAINHGSNNGSSGAANDCQDQDQKGSETFIWPDAAVPAVVALEKASHDALSSDFQKYNQKLRQMVFNLRNTGRLARRLLNGELDPSKILNMSPSELKEGLTAEEKSKKEPDESQHMQMTDARCSRCMECKVGVRDIIHAGHGDRYQLECIACGNFWYASRDEVSLLTLDGSDSTRSVGTAPWATAKFEDVEKKLVSPRESDKSGNDVFKKTSEAYMPVLEAQKSFGKSKKDENTEITRHAD